jgi:hypothetical protein
MGETLGACSEEALGEGRHSYIFFQSREHLKLTISLLEKYRMHKGESKQMSIDASFLKRDN